MQSSNRPLILPKNLPPKPVFMMVGPLETASSDHLQSQKAPARPSNAVSPLLKKPSEETVAIKMVKKPAAAKNDTTGPQRQRRLTQWWAANSIIKGYALYLLMLGLSFGTLVFLMMYYQFDVEDWIGGIIAAVATIASTLLLAFWYPFRGALALLIPSMGSKQGKALLTTLLVSLVMTGPVANFDHNLRVTTNSLNCYSSSAINQTKLASQKFIDSAKDVHDRFAPLLRKFNSIVKAVEKAVQMVNQPLEDTFKAFETATSKMSKDMNQCSAKLNEVGHTCNRQVSKVKNDCLNALNIPLIGGGIRQICNAFDMGALCAPVKWSSDICASAKEVSLMTVTSVEIIPAVFSTLLDEFKVGSTFEKQLSSLYNMSISFEEIKNQTTNEIQSVFDYVFWLSDLAKTIVSVLGFVLLMVASSIYLVRFRNSLLFDNHFVTKEMTNDSIFSQIFPLRSIERRKFGLIESYSFWLTPKEKSSLIPQLFVYFGTLVGVIIPFLVDLSFYTVIDIIRRNGRTEVAISSSSILNFEVTGNGFLSEIFRFIFKDFKFNNNLIGDLDTESCLPQPRPALLAGQSSELWITFSVLLVLGLVYVLEPYCLRSRHIIAGYFFPDVHRKRMEFLYKKILRQRGKKLSQNTEEKVKARHADNQIILENSKKIKEGFIFMKVFKKLIPTDGLKCVECGLGSSNRHKLVTGTCCSALYCTSCLIGDLKYCEICK